MLPIPLTLVLRQHRNIIYRCAPHAVGRGAPRTNQPGSVKRKDSQRAIAECGFELPGFALLAPRRQLEEASELVPRMPSMPVERLTSIVMALPAPLAMLVTWILQ